MELPGWWLAGSVLGDWNCIECGSLTLSGTAARVQLHLNLSVSADLKAMNG